MMSSPRTLLAFAAACGAVLLCGCGEPFLVLDSTMPEFRAPADKALCVVLRPMGGIGNMTADAFLFLDNKAVSGTAANSITSFEVDPGEHLVVVRMNLSGLQRIPAKVKYNFQAGKVYYLMQPVFIVPMIGVKTQLVPMPADEALKKIEDEKGKCKYAKRNPNFTESLDMSEDDLQDLRKDWDKWAKDHPEDAAKETGYPGY